MRPRPMPAGAMLPVCPLRGPTPDAAAIRQYYYATFRAAAFPGRRERSSCLFLVACEGHQADNKAK
ncbi:MAG TPA: hypothetical protein VM238_01270 [Phycisphaerae bacterium]|nr:hypothetical protein [Phycisphaerae bacterium]